MYRPYIPFTGAVKKLVLINVCVWIVASLFLEGIFKIPISSIFGLSTYNIFKNFLIFEPFTYMFLHASSPWHLLFNMLILWFLGVELERVWGRPFFVLYYIVCGIGAALIYITGKFLVFWILDKNPIDFVRVVGSSGAIYGLMLAYGILFGERIIYLMFIFPIKAKWLVTILGLLSLVTLLQSGIDSGGVSNLCHLGGIIAGYLFLVGWTKYHQRPKSRNLHVVH